MQLLDKFFPSITSSDPTCGVATEEEVEIDTLAARLRAETVAPFGGVGESGVGREGGTFSREFFTEPKAVVMQIDR